MSYDYALNHPFAPAAKGARIPDEHSFPTVTYTCTSNFVVSVPGGDVTKSGPGTTQGEVDFWVTPNPLNCIGSSYAGTFVQGGNDVVINAISGNATVARFGSEIPDAIVGVCDHSLPVNSTMFDGCFAGATSTNAIQQVMSSYRVVGFGCRIRSLLAPLNQAGQFIVATMPSPEYQPPCGQSRKTDWLRFCNYPDADKGLITTDIIRLPAADINMYAELTAEGGMEWSGRLTGPSAMKFKDSDFGNLIKDDADARVGSIFLQSTIAAGPNAGAYVSTFSDTAAQTVGGNDTNVTNCRIASSYQTGGWSSFFCRAQGVTPGTATGNGGPLPCFGVEIIFHLEGTPAITGDGNLVAAANTGIYDNAYFVKAVERNSREAWFRRIIDYGGFKGPQGDNEIGVAVRGLLSLSRDAGMPKAKKRRTAKKVVNQVRRAKRTSVANRSTNRLRSRRGRIRGRRAR